jgi:hypothetical protein
MFPEKGAKCGDFLFVGLMQLAGMPIDAVTRERHRGPYCAPTIVSSVPRITRMPCISRDDVALVARWDIRGHDHHSNVTCVAGDSLDAIAREFRDKPRAAGGDAA